LTLIKDTADKMLVKSTDTLNNIDFDNEVELNKKVKIVVDTLLNQFYDFVLRLNEWVSKDILIILSN